ncbi:MAG TPA: hypothetical protein VN777_08635 [Terriglobales bacterium]|nr:hypothetical protein [Terriglobales bacterium]
METKIGWLALLTGSAYILVQGISPSVFNHAISLVASAVWGS